MRGNEVKGGPVLGFLLLITAITIIEAGVVVWLVFAQ